jgi:predicted negative regulator of RcsB-dependent stress response
MSVSKHDVHDKDPNQVVVERAKDFWSRYDKPLMIICAVVILVAGGYFGYKKLYKEPREQKAADAMFKAESYFRNAMMAPNQDSLVNLALNGDGANYGFLKVINNYGGTDQANLAHFYAGNCFIILGDNEKAIKYLKDFSTSSRRTQARAYKLMGDAYADLGKNSDALDSYKKAARHFEEDEDNASEYYFLAAYFAEKVMNNQKEATELYKTLKEKFPFSGRGRDADKYLGRLGVYTTE